MAPVLRSPVVLVLIGIASVQVGASVAKSLFDDATPVGLVLVRLGVSSLVLVVAVRPRWRGRSRADWRVVAGYGASLGVMNLAIYESFSRIPLGVAVTLEFIGPLTVALAGSRRPRDLAWVALAATGVVLLGAERADLDPVGVLAALLAGAAWAAYILLSGATGRRWEGLDGLAVASTLAALGLLPVALGQLLTGTDPGLTQTHVLALGAVVAVLSSVLPYSLEIIALRRLAPATFGILMSLEPAAAAVAALLVLGEQLRPAQWVAVLCVVLASIGATRSARPAAPQPLAGA